MIVASGIAAYYLVRGPHDEYATLRGHRDGVFALALSPDGTLVASGGGEGAARVWDIARLREKSVLDGHQGRVQALAWFPDGESLLTGGTDNSIRLWNVRSGDEIDAWTNLPDQVRALSVSHDGQMFAAAINAAIYCWRMNDRRQRLNAGGHQRQISGIAFLPDGLQLASFSGDGVVCIWDLEKGELAAVMPGPVGHCYGMSVSRDGKTIACVGGARVHLYDVESRKALKPVEPQAHILCGAAFSPDGRTLAIGSQDKIVIIWDLPGNKEIVRLQGHDYAVGPMAFLADGDTLVTSSHDSTLKFWKVM
jgi:WD40 repeat protein